MKRCVLLVTPLLLAACAGDMANQDIALDGRPVILALNQYQARVGDPIRLYGVGFTRDRDAKTDLRWSGVFTAQNGDRTPVQAVMYTDFLDGNSVEVPFLGPFNVPFSPTGDQLGVFEGTVTPIVTEPSKGPVEGQPFPVRFEVLPSLIITDVQPVNARCARPAKRLLGDFAYRISVRAVGFRPVNFTYAFLDQPVSRNTMQVRHVASGPVDRMGDNFIFQLDPVPEGSLRYRSTLVVSSLDDQGIEHSISLPFTVHRPLEFVMSGPPQIAEIFPPTPMTGCMTGSIGGVSYSYIESQSETRSRTLALSYDQGWQQSVSEGRGTAHTESNGVNFGTATGDTVTWNTNKATEWGIRPLIGFLYQISGEFRMKTDVSEGGNTTMTRSVGEDHSKSDTVTQSIAATQGYTITRGKGDIFTISSTDSITNSFTTTIFAGHFGVAYRQTTKLLRPAQLIAYNLCGQPMVVGTSQLTDWTWSVDIAQDVKCPPFPRPQLPAAQCNIGPCGE